MVTSVKYKKFGLKVLLAAAAFVLAACQNPVYDDEGDCDVTYNLRFVYDMNLKWADAFPSEVHSVNLYAFDSNGVFVREFSANGAVVDQPGYAMQLDLNPGNYHLVAWCGMNNEGAAEKSFTVTEPVAGQTTLDEFICSLNVKRESRSQIYSDTRLEFLYHGELEVSLPDVRDGKDYYYTMYLTKDTNHIRIILQQLSGEDMVTGDFDFVIEDANGVMAYNNDLLGSEIISYRTWDVQEGEAAVGGNDDDWIASDLKQTKSVIADFSVARMMADHYDKLWLTIYDNKHERTIARVPVIQYALLSREYYELAYGHKIDKQEFLDREDEYVLTFFIDENRKWLDAAIYINSWRIVLHDYDV